MKFRSRTSLTVIVVLSFIFTSTFIIRNPYKIRTTFSYFTRPLWQSSDYPTAPILNFATSDLFNNSAHSPEAICRLHRNASPRQTPLPEIWDAIIFSHEIEMLEIHISELQDVVDRFVILESDVTYSGTPKRLFFEENRHRFEKWAHKISYKAFRETSLDGFSYKPGDFYIETQQRNAMTRYIGELGIKQGTLVLVADVDEIPYVETMQLLKMCQLPSPLHLQLTPYVYSFEWISGDLDSWHVQVHSWIPGQSYYKHSSKSTEDYLVEAGVHCSFCFQYISDFQHKMRSYSHWDRLGDHPDALLKADRIQRVICDGENIFGMLPEAYTFLDLWKRWKGTAERIGSSRRAPSIVRADPVTYSYLLPGGCQRQMQNPLFETSLAPT